MNWREDLSDSEFLFKIQQKAAFPGTTITDKSAVRPGVRLAGGISQMNLQLAQFFGAPRRAEIQIQRAVWPDRIKLQARRRICQCLGRQKV